MKIEEEEKNSVNILGINITNLTKKKVLEKIGYFLTSGEQHYIVTPNPEMALEAVKDEELFFILNNADLALADGIGLKFAAFACAKNLKRITGADLIKDILGMAEKKRLKIAIISWSRGLSSREDLEKTIKKGYPALQFMAESLERGEELLPASLIPAFAPVILFCALGASHQEKFIWHNLKNIPSVKLAMGVGGSFDLLCGRIKRAPVFFRLIGLEWLWRLIVQPLLPNKIKNADVFPWKWRIKRICNAVAIFPYKFIVWKFVLPFLYRPNVVCLLYKKEKNQYNILVVKRKDQPNHWQLPQGGIDGQNLEEAGRRELNEELGINNFRTAAVFKNLWKYKFNGLMHKGFYFNAQRNLGYKGQKQSLYIAEFTGRDEDIKINFWDHAAWKWVEAENLTNEVHGVRREATEIFLKKFKSVVKYEI